MIVFNTTFHVEEDIHEEFLEYMLQTFIPLSVKSGLLAAPRLACVMGKDDESGFSYAMEFTATDADALEKWNREESAAVYTPLLNTFREKIAGFSTVMQTIDY